MSEFVIDKYYNASIIPGKHMELNRDVIFKDKAEVDGSVYGNKVTFDSKKTFVKKSVYSNLDIYFRLEEDSKIELNSSVVANRTIDVKAEVPVLNIRFGGIVKAKNCSIKNSIIYGSVIAEDCQIENTIVFGSIICQKTFKAKNCLINSFSAKEVFLGANVTLFEPYGLSEEILMLHEPVNSLFLSASGELNNEMLHEDDIATVELYDQNENKTQQKLLSVNGRILNVRSLKDAQEKVYKKYHSYFDLLKFGDLDSLFDKERELFEEYIDH